jgi:DNA replication protein DnaC
VTTDLQPIQTCDLFDPEQRARLRAQAKPVAEIEAWEQERARLVRAERTSRIMATLEPIHDALAVDAVGEIQPDDASREGIAWARRWTPDHPGACIWGEMGSGKTTLLCRLLQRLGPSSASHQGLGLSVCLASLPRLIPVVRAASRQGHGGAILDALGCVDVLVLDDLSRGAMEKGWTQFLWQVVDARWSHGRRPLLVTSNVDPRCDPALGLRFDAADAHDIQVTLDRIRALAPIRVTYHCESRR